jgi:hypothetical protein
MSFFQVVTDVYFGPGRWHQQEIICGDGINRYFRSFGIQRALLNNHRFPGWNIVARPKGAKNRRTLLREAEQHIGSKYVDQVLDSLYVLEKAMQHFFIRAEMGKNTSRSQSEVDADYEKAAHLAALVAPYRHARLSAMKLAGDPNNPVRIRDDASMEELRAEMMHHLGILIDGGLIDLEALPVPNRVDQCQAVQAVGVK